MGITKTSNSLGQFSDGIEITGTSMGGQQKPEIVTDQDLPNILTPGYWLSDLVICYAQTILQKQYPNISGFENTKDIQQLIRPTG